MTQQCCTSCGVVIPRVRFADPGAPTRVVMVDATAVARMASADKRTTLDDVLDVFARSPRYIRCARCGALTRVGGDAAESWVRGPSEPPSTAVRRVVRIDTARSRFEELWRGERSHEHVVLPFDVGVGDTLRIVEHFAPDQRDPAEAPRFILGMVTCRTVVTMAADGMGVASLAYRELERGEELRALDARRARMIDALASSGARVATAASLLGLSVSEAYRWVHELGLEDRIKQYRTRTRSRKVGG